jgi:hypothetical protein
VAATIRGGGPRGALVDADSAALRTPDNSSVRRTRSKRGDGARHRRSGGARRGYVGRRGKVAHGYRSWRGDRASLWVMRTLLYPVALSKSSCVMSTECR